MSRIRLLDDVPHPEGWVAAIARALTFGLLAVVLALHLFYFITFQEFYYNHGFSSLASSIRILSGLGPAWWMSAAFSLCVGMASWTTSHLLVGSGRRARPTVSYRQPRRRALAVTLSCAAICGYALVHRVFTLATLPLARGPSPLASMNDRWALVPTDASIVAGALVGGIGLLGVYFVVCPSVGRDLGGRPKVMVTVFGGLVLAVWVVSAFNLYPSIGVYIPAVVWEAAQSDPVISTVHARARLQGEESGGGYRRAIDTYLRTSCPDGSFRDPFEHPGPLDCPGESWQEDLDFACQGTVLPVTRFLTTRGITLDLAEESRSLHDPAEVMEVPLGGHEVRRLRLEDGSLRETISWPAGSIPDGIGPWVLLKADASLPSSEVVSLLEHLQRAGARRVSLAALAVGMETLPTAPPVLVLGAEDDGAPRHLGGVSSRVRWYESESVVRTLISVPRRRERDSFRICYGSSYVTLWEYTVFSHDWPESGGLPRAVSLCVDGSSSKTGPPVGDPGTAGAAYQDLVLVIETAIMGGARELHLPATWPNPPEVAGGTAR